MTEATGSVYKTSGLGKVAVAVTVNQADKFAMSCAFGGQVSTPDGGSFPDGAIQAACLSGAAFARRHLGFDGLHVRVNAVNGVLHRADSDGLAIATLVAIAHAVGLSNSLHAEVLGDWSLSESE